MKKSKLMIAIALSTAISAPALADVEQNMVSVSTAQNAAENDILSSIVETPEPLHVMDYKPKTGASTSSSTKEEKKGKSRGSAVRF